jgi:hypothetical protein
MSFKVPNVNRVPLDLHKLYKVMTSVLTISYILMYRLLQVMADSMKFVTLVNGFLWQER